MRLPSICNINAIVDATDILLIQATRNGNLFITKKDSEDDSIILHKFICQLTMI